MLATIGDTQVNRCVIRSVVKGEWVAQLILQRYEGSRKPRRPADGTFQEPDSWKETKDGRRYDSEDQARFDAVFARV